MGARTSMIAAGVVAAIGLIALGGWYVLGGAAPAPVSLEGALKGIEGSPVVASGVGGGGTATAQATPAVVAATTATAAATATATAAAAPASTPRAGAAGAWAVEAATSFVGYRINEELARIGANTVVGRPRWWRGI